MEFTPSGQLFFYVLLSITCMSFITVAIKTPLLWLVKTHSTPTLSSIRMTSILRRSVLTRTNGGFLPKDQFLCRKQLFLQQSPQGLLQQLVEEETNKLSNPSLTLSRSLMNPYLLRQKVLENIANVGPQMALGAWIRNMFDGYIVCRLPFWVPERFRPMLQSGISLIGESLDIRYVSGLSWYIINIFGLQGLWFLWNGNHSMEEEIPKEWEPFSDIPQTKIQLVKQEIQQWMETDYKWQLENIQQQLLLSQENLTPPPS